MANLFDGGGFQGGLDGPLPDMGEGGPREVTKNIQLGLQAKRKFSTRLYKSFKYVRIYAGLVGQFPFSHYQDSSGAFHYKFSGGSAIYSTVLALLSFYALLVGIWNFFLTITDAFEITSTPELEEERWYEKGLLHRHLVWIISTFAAVMQTCCSYVYLYKQRHYIPSILTFYSRVTHKLHMDISEGISYSTFLLITTYVVTTMGIVAIAVLRLAPATIGTPTVFGIYLTRQFFFKEGVWIKERPNIRGLIQVVGAVFMIFLLTASKAHMFLFVYYCKVMRNSFAVWNGRAYIALMKGGKYFLTYEGKITYQLLYKDHCVILDMMEAANRCCAGFIEMYYSLQTLTIFLEIYFVIRSARYGDNEHTASSEGGMFFIRPLDWLPGLMLAIQSIVIAFYTVTMAIDVGKEARAGLDIVRRKTMLNRKTDDELFFQLSLQNSFNSFQKFDMSGGGYSYFDSDWILSYVNNIASYFIILYQFQPVLDRTTKEGEWERRRHLGEFLEDLEGLPTGHYLSTSTSPRPRYGVAG